MYYFYYHQKFKNMTKRMKLLCSISLLGLFCITVGCGGCGGVKGGAKADTKITTKPFESTGYAATERSIDTSSQKWLDQHYYRGTTISLPDSLKNAPGLGESSWFNLPTYKYEPVVFDKLDKPNLEEVQVYFMDSLTKSPIKSITLWKENPYNVLPFNKISTDNLMKIDGITRYDLRKVPREKLKTFLLSMDVNLDSIKTKIVGAEVMTGQDSPMERTSLVNSYALSIIDENGMMVAAQTTFKIYNKYGIKINDIIENGHGLYQFGITKNGKYLGAIFGGRYGCKSGQYTMQYFKIFNTFNGDAIHSESIEDSESVFANFNYIVVTTGGDTQMGFDKKIYNFNDLKIYSARIPLLRTNEWNDDGIIVNGRKIYFKDNYFRQSSFSTFRK